MENKKDYETRKCFMLYIGWLKALRDWFHSAHHVSFGTSFAGDHVDLFGRIYKETEEEIDGAIEKAIGLTNDPRFGCPILTNKTSLAILEKYDSPVYGSQEDIINLSLNLSKDYLLFLEEMNKKLERKDVLSMGLNNQLAASADIHETHIYLLQQRNNNAVFTKKQEALKESFDKSKYLIKDIKQAIDYLLVNNDVKGAFYILKEHWTQYLADIFEESEDKDYDSLYKTAVSTLEDMLLYYLSEELINSGIDENKQERILGDLKDKFIKELDDVVTNVIDSHKEGMEFSKNPYKYYGLSRSEF